MQYKNTCLLISVVIATINFTVFSQQKTQNEVFLESQVTLSPFSKIPTIEQNWNQISEEFAVRISEDVLQRTLDSVNVQIALLEKDSVIEKIIEKKLRSIGVDQYDIPGKIKLHSVALKLFIINQTLAQLGLINREQAAVPSDELDYENIAKEFEVIKYSREMDKLMVLKKETEEWIEYPPIIFSNNQSAKPGTTSLELRDLPMHKSFPYVSMQDTGFAIGQYPKFEWVSSDGNSGWALSMASTFTLIGPLDARMRVLRYRHYTENSSSSAFTIYGADLGCSIPIVTTTVISSINGNRDMSEITANIKTEAPIFIRPFIGQLDAISFESSGTKWFRAMFQPGIELVASYWHVSTSVGIRIVNGRTTLCMSVFGITNLFEKERNVRLIF